MKTKLMLFITIALLFAMCMIPIVRAEGVPYNPIDPNCKYKTPEFPVEASVMTSLGFAIVYGIRRRRPNK